MEIFSAVKTIYRFLLLFLILLQLRDLGVNAVDDLCGGGADGFKGAFQLDGISHALGLHLTGTLVG